MVKILFVCAGNLCRSPAAEAVFNGLIKQKGLERRFSCASAGTSEAQVGADYDSRMAKLSSDRGFALSGKAKHFNPQDFAEYDYIIPMDSDNRQYLMALNPPEKFRKKIILFGQFNILFDPDDVPDPYQAGPDQFVETFEIILDGCQGLLQILTQN